MASSFLETDIFEKTIVDDLVPEKSSLIMIDSKDTLPKAFNLLIKNNIYSAPVHDASRNEYLGFLDLLDIVAFIVMIFDAQKHHKNELDIDLYDLLEQVEKFDLEHATRVIGMASQNPFCPVHSGSHIKKCLEVFVRSGAHRIPIVEGKNMKSVLTQSAVVQWLNSILPHISENLRKKTIRELSIGLKEVASVRVDATALDAFRLMAERKIHAVAVVDEKGEIFSNISAKDIKVLQPDALFTRMYRPAMELIQHVRSLNMKAVFPSFCITLDNTFEEAVRKLAVLNVHRLYIEDSGRKPIGVISLGDILSVLLNEPEHRVLKC